MQKNPCKETFFLYGMKQHDWVPGMCWSLV